MAVSDKTIDPKILQSARVEFLRMGFEKASLKEICLNAGVTTGALYKRYKGKDELFCAVVERTVNDLMSVLEEKASVSFDNMSDHELFELWTMDESFMMWWFDYLYQRYEDFVLLLKYSAGSSYCDFADTWVENMNVYSYNYYEESYRRGIAKKYVSREEMHVLLSAFWTCMYEPFIHEMKWEQIEEHCRIVCNYFNWHKALEFVTV